MRPVASSLDFALLGLLARRPASGYDLRKIFQETPLGLFSDSPGSVYPALRRLEAGDLVEGRSEPGGRRRRRYVITARGRSALRAWLLEPITLSLVARGSAPVELRLAFLSDTLPRPELARFLRAFADAVEAQLASFLEVQRSVNEHLSVSGRLALDLGITLIRARAAWCRRAARKEKQR